MSKTYPIVIVNATVVEAPAPDNLQQSGALVSVGGTSLTTGTIGGPYLTAADALAVVGASGNHAELTNEIDTFFAQGNGVGVYILELGTQSGTVTAQITALGTWITANPNQIYAFVNPASWDTSNSSDVNTLAATYSSATGKTYFFQTTTTAHMAAYTNKAMFTVVPNGTVGSTEMTAAAFFYQWIVQNPNLATPAAPMQYRFLFGVTPWATAGNGTTLDSILTANANYVGTGAEGGISQNVLRNGTTADGNQAMFWYGVDWVLINAQRRLANAVINGSNRNPPLQYNQFGINELLAVLTNLGADGVSFQLLLDASFTATPFAAYVAANPSDYAAGTYKGFSATVTPQVGLIQITFNLVATEIPT